MFASRSAVDSVVAGAKFRIVATKLDNVLVKTKFGLNDSVCVSFTSTVFYRSNQYGTLATTDSVETQTESVVA